MFRNCFTLTSILLMLGFLRFVTPAHAQTPPHPFLIVSEDMYPELQIRSNTEPWTTLKTKAIDKSDDTLDPAHWDWWFQASDIVGANSLSYILDPANQPLYRDRIIHYINEGYEDLPDINDASVNNIGGCYFETEVRPGTFLVNAIVAFDVIYNDLDQSVRDTTELRLGEMVAKIDCGWEWNLFSVHAVWELFKGNITPINGERNDYHDWKGYYDQAMSLYTFTDDGVFSGGPGYGRARFNWRRDSKYVLMDIAEFTKDWSGVSPSELYYNNPRFIGFYEWYYGYAMTPMGSHTTFGDTGPSSRIEGWSTTDGHAPVRAYRFSPAAGGYAAFRWQAPRQEMINDLDPNLFSYVLMEQDFTQLAPIVPKSRIFKDGGATFMENDYQFTSLQGTLWNNTKRVWHTHSDVNALHLSAYGENILQNVGYIAAGNAYANWQFYYVSHEAKANNTLVIDNVNHKIGPTHLIGNGGDYFANYCEIPSYASACGSNANANAAYPYTKRGAGISEGFTSTLFDYASGATGHPNWSDYDGNRPESVTRVIINGHHQRNFVFIHPQDNLAGYFVTIDEIEAYDYDFANRTTVPKPNAIANLYFHPNAGSPTPEHFWLRFDGNLTDTTNKRPGTLVGSSYSYVTNRFGTYQGSALEQAIDLNGSYVSVNNSESLSFPTTSFALSVWFKSQAENTQTLISKGNLVANTSSGKLQLEADGRLSFAFTNESGQPIEISSTQSGYNDNLWHNVIVSIYTRLRTNPDGTTYHEVVPTLYGNGVQLATITHIGQIHHNTLDPWLIGAESDGIGGAQNLFIGAIDDVRFNNNRYQSDSITTLANRMAGAPQLLQQNEEYLWDITGNVRFNRVNDVDVAIVLGQNPSAISFPWSYLANGGSSGWQTLGYHFRADFSTDTAGKANVPTVIYPIDIIRPKPSLNRIASVESEGYNALTVNSGEGLVDYIVAVPVDNPTPHQLAGVELAANAAIFRKGTAILPFYFARQGTKLYDSNVNRGFESDVPISIHLRNYQGSVSTTQPAQLTIFGQNITRVTLNAIDVAFSPLANGVQFSVPEGTFALELNGSAPQVTPGDTDADGDVDYLDYQTILSNFSSIYDIFDFNILVTHFGQ
jgi:hypothetical protein